MVNIAAVNKHWSSTAIPIIIEGLFQIFQQFSSSELVLVTVESCFVALNYYGNGSTSRFTHHVTHAIFIHATEEQPPK